MSAPVQVLRGLRARLSARGSGLSLALAASLLSLWGGQAQAQAPVQVQAQAQAPAAATLAEAPPASADPALERRVMDLSAELRCLVCQNQTIADSNAELAVDLRNQVRDMLREGQTDAQVLDYMTARYGDFVLYRPPLNPVTALLWFGPALLLVGGVGTLWLILYRRSRLAPEAFEPDLDADLDAASAPEGGPSSPVPHAKT